MRAPAHDPVAFACPSAVDCRVPHRRRRRFTMMRHPCPAANVADAAAGVSATVPSARHDPYACAGAATPTKATAPTTATCPRHVPPYRPVAALARADAGTHATVAVSVSGLPQPKPQPAAALHRAVVAALSGAAGGPRQLDLRGQPLSGPVTVAIGAATALTVGRRGAPLRLPGSFGEGATVVVHRCLSCPPAAAAAAVSAPPAQPLPLPLYVRADPASHVWLAVGQVGFGFAGDQAAVCGMLRSVAPGVVVLAASNVAMKAGRGRSGLWHVLVSKADAPVLLARHRCLRFVAGGEYVCFDTPAEAAACEEAHVSAPVTIELMRGPVPEHLRDAT